MKLRHARSRDKWRVSLRQTFYFCLSRQNLQKEQVSSSKAELVSHRVPEIYARIDFPFFFFFVDKGMSQETENKKKSFINPGTASRARHSFDPEPWTVRYAWNIGKWRVSYTTDPVCLWKLSLVCLYTFPAILFSSNYRWRIDRNNVIIYKAFY